MKTPAFWSSRNFISTALLPFSWLYDIGRVLHKARARSERLEVPVICVGNLLAGGAGKTPVALAIGEMLRKNNIDAFFLSRGYGGAAEGCVRVDPQRHTAAGVGDEPLLLAQVLPTIVAKDRLAGARFAIGQGAKVIVMDDGLQNFSIAKTLSLAVVDGVYGFGNGYLLPAGPLREPIDTGLARCDAAIVINAGGDMPLPHARALFHASTSPVDADFVKNNRWVAFCGIAQPAKFFATLHNLGGHVMKTRSFADHHPYLAQEIEALRKEAEAHGAGLITTAKDMMRIPHALRDNIRTLNITLSFAQKDAFETLILSAAGASCTS